MPMSTDHKTPGSEAAILVVDDNLAKRLAITSVLEPLGHTIIDVSSGEAALREVTKRQFALITMDVQMPVMDGYETARLIRLRQEAEHTPIIFLTSAARDEVEVPAAYASGAVDFIFAPIVPDTLRAKASIFIELFLKSRELEASVRDLTGMTDKLHESEVRLKAAQSLAKLGSWEWTPEGDCFTWSDELARALGRDGEPPPATLGEYAALVHPDDRGNWERTVGQTLAGGATETEYRVMRPDGSQRWLLGRRVRTTGPYGGERVHSTVQDITERRVAETAAAQLARDNELILSSTEQGIFRIAVDGRITFVNAAAERLLGYAPGELIGRQAHEEMHHSHPDGSRYPVRDCPIHDALRDGHPRRVSGEHFWRADGTGFPVDYASAPILEGDELVGAVILFTDISERVRMERAMRVAEERFRHSFDRAPIGIALISLQGCFQRVNAALCDLTGYPEQELLNLRFQDITHIDDLEAAEGHMSELIAGERPAYDMEKRCQHADGHVIGIQMNGTLVRDGDGTPQYVIAQVQDISRRKDLERQMQEAAHRDPLTDLYNRRGFTEEFQRTVAYTYRYERSGAVLMIDLDGFKEVNDRLGHKAGDELLAGIAEKLRDRLRRSDLIGRLGGDEFAVVLVEVSAAEATRVADDIRELVRRQGRLVSGDEPGATASIGVAPFDGAAGQEELLNRADQAMYQAKQDGGDRVQLATGVPVAS